MARPLTPRLNLFTGSELQNLVEGNRHTNEETGFVRKEISAKFSRSKSASC